MTVLLALAIVPGAAVAQERQEEKKEEPTALSRGVGAATVAIDPLTGRLVPPTVEQRRRLAEALAHLVDQRTDDLVVERRANGMRFLDLRGRFQNVTLLSLAPDGSRALQCVADPLAAAAWLEGEPAPQFTAGGGVER